MREMEIPEVWRRAQTRRGDTARPRHSEPQPMAADCLAITDVVQQCRRIIPILHLDLLVDGVAVTVTSGRPGVGGQVSVAVNLNSLDGGYQGPLLMERQGQFTATTSQVQATFTILPDQWPVLGVFARADWDDGAETCYALTYKDIACGWPWWWRLLTRLIRSLRLVRL
jgi:hypothetical protein